MQATPNQPRTHTARLLALSLRYSAITICETNFIVCSGSSHDDDGTAIYFSYFTAHIRLILSAPVVYSKVSPTICMQVHYTSSEIPFLDFDDEEGGEEQEMTESLEDNEGIEGYIAYLAPRASSFFILY